jgi:hypothetical protein
LSFQPQIQKGRIFLGKTFASNSIGKPSRLEFSFPPRFIAHYIHEKSEYNKKSKNETTAE